jgi:hypothetical protein
MVDPVGLPTARERLRFFPSQRLLASDLQNLEGFGREMRWLHNRSLHQPGVASGFAVLGPKGAREVTVGPGYAIDALGREIVLTQTITLAVPPVAGDRDGGSAFFDLAVSYPDSAQLETTETRGGFCGGQEAVRLREVPSFEWINVRQPGPALADLLAAKRIALGRAEVIGCKLVAALSLEHRRDAKPSPLPYIAAGISGDDVWSYPDSASAFGIELTAKIETTSAAFRSVPHYFVSVVGERALMVGEEAILLDGFTSISKATSTGFRLAMLLPSMLATSSRASMNDVLNQIRNKLPWCVEWVGVEG